MDSFLQDVRYSLRMMFKKPGFTAVAVMALALGIGANTAIFSVVYSVVLRPLPYKDADRLLVTSLSIPDYRDLKEANRVFDEMAIWASNQYSLSTNGEAHQVLGGVVSPGFFSLLGQASLGRTFEPDEDRQPLAVLSYDLWRSRFGADPNVLGQAIDLGGRPHTIIGVMPKEFQFPSQEFKLWVTFGSALAETPKQLENRQLRIFRALLHLKPGVSLSEAQVESDSIAARMEQQNPDTNSGFRFRLTPLYERIVGDVRTALFILLGTVGFVLLIACANVANLTLARVTAREREIAIRTALGAGRWRIVRQLLTESVMLAVAGGGLGLLLAVWGIDLLPGLNPSDIPRLNTISISVPVLLFTLAVSVLTGVLFGLVPAFQAARYNINESLKEGGRGVSGSHWGERMRGVLIVGEIALSLVVVIGAGLLIKSFTELLKTDVGFAPDNLMTMNLELFRFKDTGRRTQVAREIISRLEQIPGIEAVGGNSGFPLVSPQRVSRFAREGQDSSAQPADTAYFMATIGDYFRAIGTPLVSGRTFNDRDAEGSPKVVIVNNSLARSFFSGEDPVGKRLKLVSSEKPEDWYTVVGVVGDVKYSGLDDTVPPAIYTPFAQTPFLWSYLMVRTAGDPSKFVAIVRDQVASVDPNIKAVNIQPMRQVISKSVAQPRFYMLLLSAFALLALVLASVGIYGVMSYSVTQRTHEIGIRMALGASSTDVLKLVLKQSLLLASIGVAIGIGAAIGVTRLMASLLYGVSATDPATFAIISLLLIAVALLASYIPARRAMKVDPMVALRYE